MRSWQVLCVFIWCCVSLAVRAGDQPAEVLLSGVASGQSLDRYLAWQEDAPGRLDLPAALAGTWQQEQQEEISLGYSRSVFWFRTVLKNDQEDAAQYLFNIAYPVLDHVVVYIKKSGEDWRQFELGDKQPFSKRLFDHRQFLFSVAFDGQESVEMVFRVKTSSAVQFPLSVWRGYDFFISDQWSLLAQGFFFGLMAVMVFYNLFIYFSVREIGYLYYVLYVLFDAAFFAGLKGFSFQLLWPNSTSWNDVSIFTLLACTALFVVLFTKRFLELRRVRILNFVSNCFLVTFF